MSKGISIIIPCYNEAPKVLHATVEDVKSAFKSDAAIDYEILIVNDGSKKYQYADEFEEAHVSMVHHKVNKGYGAALKTGITHAKHKWIGITDADGTYPNQDFSEFVKHMDEYDMIVGARPWKDISAAINPVRGFPWR